MRPHHHHLPLLLERFKLEIAKLAIEAQAKGPSWAVYLGDPARARGETPEEQAVLEAAKKRGVYVGLHQVPELEAALMVAFPEGEARAGALAALQRPAPPDHVHVLGILVPEVVTLDAPVVPEKERERIRRIEALIDQATPIARRRAAEGIPARSIFIAEPDADGVRVELATFGEALQILPLDGVVDASRFMQRYAQPPPAGSFRLAVVYGGGFSVATIAAE